MKSSMLWLLDTNVVSESVQPKPDQNVVRWLAAHIDECVLCGVTIGEIEYGLYRMPAGAKKRYLQSWYDVLTNQMAERIIGTSVDVWSQFGKTRHELQRMGRPQADMDILIASTAITHRLTLVTRNTRHFDDTGCDLFNPWDDGQSA
jgi:toxin FitB